MQDEYIVYGAELSYYSGKVRAYMRWKDIPFSEIRPSQDIYRNEIVPAVGYPVIPVIKLNDGTIIQDTTDIIDFFEAHVNGPSVYPEGPKQRLAALLLELYGDKAIERYVRFMRELSGNPGLVIDEEIFNSEKSTGNKNYAFAHYMKSYGNLNHEVEDVLDLYFKFCSL